MKEKVYLIKLSENDAIQAAAEKLKGLINSMDLLNYIEKNDMTAIKTHFGEDKKMGYVKPPIIKMLGQLIEQKKANPFLTETSTLYKGNRTDAVNHIKTANKHGFGYENTGLPIIMSDGLFGDEETEINISGKINTSVKIASLISKIQSMIIVSHFTGHMIAGYGAAIKNLGMGCSSRKGKLIQHSTVKPSIKEDDCTKCGECIKWCPTVAIIMVEKNAQIDSSKCIGCGQCLAVCRFDAVEYNWGATHEDLQKNIVEYAWGVTKAINGKALYINSLCNISKECDCMPVYEKIVNDIGILVSFDPVAIDSASLDLVEKISNKNLSEIAHNIPYKFQIQYAKELGFGNAEYELIEY